MRLLRGGEEGCDSKCLVGEDYVVFFLILLLVKRSIKYNGSRSGDGFLCGYNSINYIRFSVFWYILVYFCKGFFYV